MNSITRRSVLFSALGIECDLLQKQAETKESSSVLAILVKRSQNKGLDTERSADEDWKIGTCVENSRKGIRCQSVERLRRSESETESKQRHRSASLERYQEMSKTSLKSNSSLRTLLRQFSNAKSELKNADPRHRFQKSLEFSEQSLTEESSPSKVCFVLNDQSFTNNRQMNTLKGRN